MAVAQALQDDEDDAFYNDVASSGYDIDGSLLEMRWRSASRACSDADDLAQSSESYEEDERAGFLNRTAGEEGERLKFQTEEDRSAGDTHVTGLGGTLSSVTLGIIKGMVGPAILYLPHGFASAGYLVAIPVLMLSTMMFLWSSRCLLESWKMESDRANGKLYKHHMRIALSYPELTNRAFGPLGEKLVEIGISLMQSGVCLTYLIFVPQNLCSSALLLLNWDISTNWTLALMVAMQIPMSWIRDIRRLTVTNLLANVLILYGLLTCLGFAINEMGNDAKSSAPFLKELTLRMKSLPAFNSSGWFLFLGTSVLLFEGSITLLVPLQEAVHTPVDRDKFPDLYFKVILGIVAFYSFFGIICWMAFGNDVRTVMTTSLPPGTLATTVQLAYSLAVVFTFPLQNFPSLEIVCATVERMLSSGHDKVRSDDSNINNIQRNVISTLVVISLSIIAVLTMNDLDKVVSLMGSLLGCPLAFVVPPLIQNKLEKGQVSKWKRCVNVLVALLGICAMVISSITTVLKWE